MEEFKKVTECKKELQNLYLISNEGRVFSLQQNRFIKWRSNGNGYYNITLRKNNITQKFFIHRLVAIHFIPNPDNKPFINHIDCNPSNNKVDNLEWCSHKENMEYASKLGRFNKTAEWTEKIRKASHKKAIIGIHTQTGEVLIYPSIQATKKDGFEPSCVCQCCEGIRKTHKKIKWQYGEESK